MILITGAKGNLGSSVVAQLKKRIGTEGFVVTSSSAEGVAALQAQGFQARLANFNDPASLNAAFKGVTKLLLISTMDQNRFGQHKNVIDAAKAQGVEHIYYTGLGIKDIQTSAVKDLMISHFETEDYIVKSGFTYTMLRNTMYADALTQILGPTATTGPINLPGGSGKVPYALRREMGEAIANLLTENGHENKTYNIVGSQAYGYAEVAQALSELTGNSLGYNDLPEGDFVNFLKQVGMPDFLVYLHAGTIKDIKNTQYEIESKTLETVLGRPTASLHAMLKELFKL